MISKEDVIAICKTVDDPEIHLDIYTLGLIYDIRISDDDSIHIVMTYTTPLCPFGARMQEQLQKALHVLHPSSVTISVTFDPPWKVSDELRQALGI